MKGFLTQYMTWSPSLKQMLIRRHALLCVAFLEEEHGRERRKTSDSRDLDWKKGNSELLHAKNLNTPVLWEPERSDWLRTQPALCFSSAFCIPCLQANMLSLNILVSDWDSMLRCCLQSSQVLL